MCKDFWLVGAAVCIPQLICAPEILRLETCVRDRTETRLGCSAATSGRASTANADCARGQITKNPGASGRKFVRYHLHGRCSCTALRRPPPDSRRKTSRDLLSQVRFGGNVDAYLISRTRLAPSDVGAGAELSHLYRSCRSTYEPVSNDWIRRHHWENRQFGRAVLSRHGGSIQPRTSSLIPSLRLLKSASLDVNQSVMEIGICSSISSVGIGRPNK